MEHSNPTFTDTNNTGAWRARRVLLWGAVLTATLVAPSIASAADTVVVPDAAAEQVTALDGTIVWVSGTYGKQTLWQQTAGGVARVKGAPEAVLYNSIDLGRNTKNKLVLTYQRCGAGSCKMLNDDLKGHRRSFRNLTLKRCKLATAPARWRSRSAYGLSCTTSNNQVDEGRSGLYVKTGSKAPKRLPRPADARRFHITAITMVDLRGTYVSAVIADNYQYAFVQTTSGKSKRSIFSAASEGDSDEHTLGLALGAGGTMWALTQAEHSGDPNLTVIFRASRTCYDRERLFSPINSASGVGIFRARDIAVDGPTVYLVVPGTGIVTHEFAAVGDCTPL